MIHDGNLFFVIFILASYIIKPSSSCPFLIPKWTISINNQLDDDVVVHIVSTDHDLGNHTITSGSDYQWTFCEKIFATSHFHGYFWKGKKQQSLALADRKIMDLCRSEYSIGSVCYWVVMSDEFYVSPTNEPFPSGWEKKKSW
ncbi:self-incompatibility protein S1-like [Rutidosis leptorrhynchoides]|uniref:self-incompatibility protein S1-like n=1 Tax=Rutidosis leptorrhynchoides TaxID=125765 RepID=UPI003A99125D